MIAAGIRVCAESKLPANSSSGLVEYYFSPRRNALPKIPPQALYSSFGHPCLEVFLRGTSMSRRAVSPLLVNGKCLIQAAPLGNNFRMPTFCQRRTTTNQRKN